MNKKNILVTGASGFIGSLFIEEYSNLFSISKVSLQEKKIEEIDFSGIDTVLHLAGKVHEMTPIADKVYFDINEHLTLNFAKEAKSAGVNHFIFISTIKVYGEKQLINSTISLQTLPVPDEPYGASKYAAEQGLLELQSDLFKISILRIPLVYGKGVKGNLLKLLKLAQKPFPLPFKGIENERSLLYVRNLNAFISTIILQGSEGIFLVADTIPMSTEKIIQTIRLQMKKPIRIFRLPHFVLTLIHRFKPELHKRLFNSLKVDSRESFEKVNFKPPYSTEQGFEDMVSSFLKSYQ
ncbi:MAG: NAD-dependent epimerase/dehydratase family protein [Bacteroidota bacterium]